MSVADMTSALTPRQFADFSTFIAQHLGIKMPPSKQVMLQSRLHRRLRELGLDSFAEYHERFFRDEAAQADEKAAKAGTFTHIEFRQESSPGRWADTNLRESKARFQLLLGFGQ